jgi:hypothetical protein
LDSTNIDVILATHESSKLLIDPKIAGRCSV